MTNAPGQKTEGAVVQPGSCDHDSAPQRLIAAEVVRVEQAKATRVVTIRCPFCLELHQHGWPNGMATIGPRVAHCQHRPAAGARSYWIPTPGDEAA